MKDYKNVAEDVFRRSKEVIEENKRRRRKRAEIGISAVCWAAVGVVGIGILTNINKQISTQGADDSVSGHDDDYIGGGVFLHGAADQNGFGNTSYNFATSNNFAESYNYATSYPQPSNGSESGDANSEYTNKAGVDIRCIPIVHLPLQPENSENGVPTSEIHGRITNLNGYVDESFSPANGTAEISTVLKKAISLYGREDKNGEIDYQVVIEYYKDGERIDSTKELWESESARGAKVSLESQGKEWGAYWEHHILARMTVDEIESFEPSEEYGCVLYLYGSYFGHPYKYDDNIINGLYNDGVYFE